MKREFVKYLACPTCREAVRLAAPAGNGKMTAGEDIQDGTLSCRCAEYRIVQGVPRFTQDQYAGSFGRQWNLFRRTQLDTTTLRASEGRFATEIGFPLTAVRDRLVLDAGCGMGRFADVVSRWGGHVVGVDLSSAVDAAYDNIGRRPNVHLVQADMGALPFQEAIFDYIYSIGVIHHTPDPPRFFSRLVPFLKPGGVVSVCVYSREVSRLLLVKRKLFRRVFSRLPESMLLPLSRRLGALGYHLAHLPVLRKSVALWPAVVYPDLPREWSELDTFDWLAPAYEFRYTREDVCGWFRKAGLVDIRVTEGVPGWVCVTGAAAAAPVREVVFG